MHKAVLEIACWIAVTATEHISAVRKLRQGTAGKEFITDYCSPDVYIFSDSFEGRKGFFSEDFAKSFCPFHFSHSELKCKTKASRELETQ